MEMRWHWLLCTWLEAGLLQCSLALDPQAEPCKGFAKVGNVTSFVDNFDFTNNATFEQRTMTSTFDQWWKPGNPILFFFGGEGSVETFYNPQGAVFEHAQVLDALVVFLEHRSYGKSVVPKRTLTVEQALADTAWFLSGLRAHLGCQQRECPIIVLGGSYGGMLVAWFRQKYPTWQLGELPPRLPSTSTPRMGARRPFGTPRCTPLGSMACRAAPGVDRGHEPVEAESRNRAGAKRGGPSLGILQGLHNETSAGAKADFFIRGVVATLAMLGLPGGHQLRDAPAGQPGEGGLPALASEPWHQWLAADHGPLPELHQWIPLLWPHGWGGGPPHWGPPVRSSKGAWHGTLAIPGL